MGNTQCCQSSSNKISVRHGKDEFHFKASIKDKVLELKSKIAQTKKLSLNSITLVYNGKQLSDQETLENNGFNPLEDHIFMSVCSDDQKYVTITVRNINFVDRVQVKTTQQVKSLKNKINKKYSMSSQAQRLIYNGQILNDNQQLAKYNIQQDSVVHLVYILPRE